MWWMVRILIRAVLSEKDDKNNIKKWMVQIQVWSDLGND